MSPAPSSGFYKYSSAALLSIVLFLLGALGAVVWSKNALEEHEAGLHPGVAETIEAVKAGQLEHSREIGDVRQEVKDVRREVRDLSRLVERVVGRLDAMSGGP